MSTFVRKVRLRFPAHRERLARARDLVRAALAADPSGAFTGEDMDEILLGLQESLSNASRHNPDPLVELSFWIRAGRFHACLRGRGPAFDPDQVRPPDEDHPAEHGYGLLLLKRTMDRVRYRRVGSWNLLRLVRAGTNRDETVKFDRGGAR
jgi:anti-sigma regulatory factor (Ser/Thr protein kinase)